MVGGTRLQRYCIKLKALANWLQQQGKEFKAHILIQAQFKIKFGHSGLELVGLPRIAMWLRGSMVLGIFGRSSDKPRFDARRPHTEHCGTCTRCIDACPTDAITQPFVVDANRCIATTRLRIEPRCRMRCCSFPRLGCRLRYLPRCLPWNQRFAKNWWLTFSLTWNAPKLTELAEISDEEWGKRFPASALRRIKPEMLRETGAIYKSCAKRMTKKSFCLILMAQLLIP